MIRSEPPPVTVSYAPIGASREVFRRRDPEVVLSGPAGTGKTRSILEKVHLCASKYPGMRGLLLRKTHADLVGSALVTYQRKVVHPLDSVTFFGGSSKEPPAFHYPNGSEILLGGLDRASKVMSKEFDIVYINEATEISEDDYESVTTRLRNGVMPYQQLLADCNPGPPTHWLKRRAESGRTVMLESRHEHNPLLWDPDQEAWTPFGATYIDKLDALTGARKSRLRYGIWAAAEGMVFESWDPAVHIVDRFDIPPNWSRYWTVDFGYTNPFCWQAWAESPDGRLYRYREIYHTQRTVKIHAQQIAQVTAGEPRPVAIICDHDAEDRATLEQEMNLGTTLADKRVSSGLQSMQNRLKTAGDGHTRLSFMRGSLVERDPHLMEMGKPTCSEEEVEGYVWNLADGRKKGEEPIKKDDHGMDATRYMVMHLDGGMSDATALSGDTVSLLANYRGV